MIKIAGEAAANSFSSVAAIGDFPGKADFDAKYKAATTRTRAPTAVRLRLRADRAPGHQDRRHQGRPTREAVRAAGADPNTTFETVLGPVKFDANGDTNQKIISLYAVDLTAGEGNGDWVFDSQVDFK